MTKTKPYTINNFSITKVFPGPEGVRGEKKTPWQVINFYIDHDKASDKRFTKFVNPNEPENHPYAGAEVKKMEFTEKKSGEYTNYDVTNIEYAETQSTSDAKESQKETPQGSPASPPQDKKDMSEWKAPWEEGKASPGEVTDSAPAKGRSMDMLNACIAACTTIISLYMQNHPKGNEITYEIARDQITTGAVIMHNDIMKGLERWTK